MKVLNGAPAPLDRGDFMDSVVGLSWRDKKGRPYSGSAVVVYVSEDKKTVILGTVGHNTAEMASGLVIQTNTERIVANGDQVSAQPSTASEYDLKKILADPGMAGLDRGAIKLTGPGLEGIDFHPAKLAAAGPKVGDVLTFVGHGLDERGQAGTKRYGTSRVVEIVGETNTIAIQQNRVMDYLGVRKLCDNLFCFSPRSEESKVSNAITASGDSGGGAFNSNGELVGFVEQGTSDRYKKPTLKSLFVRAYLSNIHDTTVGRWFADHMGPRRFVPGGYSSDHTPQQPTGAEVSSDKGDNTHRSVEGDLVDVTTGRTYTTIPDTADQSAPESADSAFGSRDAADETDEARDRAPAVERHTPRPGK